MGYISKPPPPRDGGDYVVKNTPTPTRDTSNWRVEKPKRKIEIGFRLSMVLILLIMTIGIILGAIIDKQ